MRPENIDCIDKFYGAFAKRDAEGMAACYHQDLEFEDPVFGALDYKQACAMWAMLVKAGKDLEITHKNAWSENVFGGADWLAVYTFSKTGRKVHNNIDAKFKFKDGLIIGHRDYFDFYKWSRMAFGTTGLLLGWTKYFRKKVSQTALGGLKKFMSETETN